MQRLVRLLATVHSRNKETSNSLLAVFGEDYKVFQTETQSAPHVSNEVESSSSMPSIVSDSLTDDSSSCISLADFDDDSTTLSSDLDPG